MEELFYGTKPSSSKKESFLTPQNGSKSNSPAKNLPRFDWIQKTDNITVIFYTKNFSNPQIQITTPTKQNEIKIYLIYSQNCYVNTIKFTSDIHWPCKIKTNYETGKVEVVFRKIEPKIWDSFGTLRQEVFDQEEVCATKVKYIVLNKCDINYNTCILALQRKDGHRQTIPIGHHVRVVCELNGKLFKFV